MAKGIKTQIRAVIAHKSKEIASFASYGRVAAGLASEGYNGGYVEALRDVLLALNGVTPHNWEGISNEQTQSRTNHPTRSSEEQS